MPPTLRPIAVAFVALGTFLGAWAVITADIQRALGVGDGVFGLVLALALAGTAGVGAITGTYVERWGVAPVLASATGAFAVLVGLLGLLAGTRSFPLLTLVIVAIFAASGAVDVTMNIAATSVLSGQPGRLVRFHGWFNAGAALGAGLTALIERFSHHDWRLALAIPTVSMALATAIVSRAHVPVGESGEHQGFGHALRTVRAEGLLLLAAVFAFGAMVEGGIDTWGVLVLRDQLGIGIVVGAVAAMTGQGVAALARATLGPAAGSLGTIRGVALGAGLAAAGLVLVSVAPAPLAVVGLILGASGISVCWPMLLAHADQGLGGTAGVVSGMTAIGYLGFVLGPALIGGLAGLVGLRPALLLLAFVATGVAIAPRFTQPVAGHT